MFGTSKKSKVPERFANFSQNLFLGDLLPKTPHIVFVSLPKVNNFSPSTGFSPQKMMAIGHGLAISLLGHGPTTPGYIRNTKITEPN